MMRGGQENANKIDFSIRELIFDLEKCVFFFKKDTI